MINMMYLVLTAMLALNVASEVLESFRVVDASLVQTLNNIRRKNDQIYDAFYAADKENHEKVGAWKDKADQVRVKTQEMTARIKDLKEQLSLASGGVSLKEVQASGDNLTSGTPFIVNSKGDTILIKKEDDLNAPSEIMIQKKKAAELKTAIIDYRDFLTSLLDKDSPLSENIKKQLDTSDPKIKLSEGGEKKSWESNNFENKPLIAVVTLLSKIQVDIENAETNVISALYSQIDAASFKFNRLGARILPKSTYVMEGDQFEAEIFLAAEDTTQQPEIYVGNTQLAMRDGKGIYKATATQTGTFKWGGLIKYKTPEGNVNSYPFQGEYQVGKPTATISLTKMNVLYQNIPNPITVSVPGVASENLEITFNNGRFEKTGEGFFVYPSKLDATGKNTSITVMVKANGQSRLMGSFPYRVKEVPPPVATIGGKNGGAIKKEELLAEGGIFAELKDFDFDLKFRVTQFDISFSGSGGYVNTYSSKDNKFTNEQRTQFGKLTAGSIIYIDKIMARGDEGSTRELSPISFKIR
jgi:gliding motility-associated protein GldM